jgi:hypothetical protein
VTDDHTFPTTSDDRPGTGRAGSRATRRGLLAAAGTALVAGCSGFDGLTGDGEPTVRAFDLPDVDPETDPRPAVPPAVPVDVAGTHFADSHDRVTALLSELPTLLGPAEIPNGHVRQHLLDAAADATDGLDDARAARTGWVALQALQRARSEARYAAAGWAVADRGLTAETVRRGHRETASAAESARADHEYVGTDPVRATLVHARTERLLERAAAAASVRPDRHGRLLTVAEWGAAAEEARARLSDARHLTDQYAASLPSDAGTVADRLTAAAETLLADVRSRHSSLPPEPTADEWGIAEEVLSELRREADLGTARVADAPGPASAVVDANRRLAHFRSFGRVREAVAAGEVSGVESAEALRTLRAASYDALETALAGSPAPGVARPVVTDAAWRVLSGDRELARLEGTVPAGRLDRAVGEYTVARALARAAPAACRQVVDALEPP